jgi:uncharacterized surface protein with fasciclin (FAS1) repeats
VAGRLSSDLWAKVKAGNGKAELTTVQGGKLTVMAKDKKLCLVDEKGEQSWISIADVNYSNGVIHVVNAVLMPNNQLSIAAGNNSVAFLKQIARSVKTSGLSCIKT